MYALTVRQPWAVLIAHGDKNIENRSWDTPYRGPLLIHAGTARVPAAEHQEFGSWWNTTVDRPVPRMVYGAIVAIANLATICPGTYQGTFLQRRTCCSQWAEPGSRHWHLDHIQALTNPVPARGRQRLWTPTADVIGQVRKELESAVNAAAIKATAALQSDPLGPTIHDWAYTTWIAHLLADHPNHGRNEVR